jgi:ABC-type multidrug transport system ATPase subunit
MKSILALVGRSKVGKSTTIKSFYELILSKYPDAKVVGELNVTKVEVRVILSIHGKLVGIESRGDARKCVEYALDIFGKAKCDVIVCAKRTSGGTCDAVREFSASQGYKITPIKKPIELTAAKQKTSNAMCAAEILKSVEALLL